MGIEVGKVCSEYGGLAASELISKPTIEGHGKVHRTTNAEVYIAAIEAAVNTGNGAAMSQYVRPVEATWGVILALSVDVTLMIVRK